LNICDRVVELLSSPYWRIPIESFIDERCGEFDGADENSHHQKETHQEFVSIVDSMLEECLEAMRIPHSEFVSCCSHLMFSANFDSGRREIVSALLACDDFSAFKNWMVARNFQLESEALKAMKYIQQKNQTHKKSNSEQFEDELAAVMALSLRDTEIQAADAQREEAELAMAIAMSLALEQQKQQELEPVQQKQEEEFKEDSSDNNNNYNHSHSHHQPVAVSHSSPSSSSLSTSHRSSSAAKEIRAPVVLNAIKSKPKINAPSFPQSIQTEKSDTSTTTTPSVPASNEFQSSNSSPKLTEAELHARRAFLREQRELIIARNRRDGERQVNDWKNQENQTKEIHNEKQSEQKLTATAARQALIESLRLAEAHRRGE